MDGSALIEDFQQVNLEDEEEQDLVASDGSSHNNVTINSTEALFGTIASEGGNTTLDSSQVTLQNSLNSI